MKDFIFGEDQPFPQCHASTLLRRPDGQFLVAWFGRSDLSERLRRPRTHLVARLLHRTTKPQQWY